ncbi:MAG TPA: 2-oxo acid dehydrogenase subunit E2 [Phaeodactylibacter sp.]|nr:2-oxo acid dehydrogenase subunit E2 [Phaeodactylibacter sp.]
MAQVELIMPKMGESIMEATILKWVKNVGDSVEADETILEIATDKVDSEVPSPVSGVIKEIFFQVDDVVEIEKVIAIIATEGEEVSATPAPSVQKNPTNGQANGQANGQNEAPKPAPVAATSTVVTAPMAVNSSNRFYSPLVKNIAKQENIGVAELDTIPGTGAKGRVTKKDILSYLANRTGTPATAPAPTPQTKKSAPTTSTSPAPQINFDGGVEIVEMDRMRKLIADHMVMSKHTSPHVTSFIEVDVTNIVNWRNKIKGDFQKTHGEKITFTPIFIEAVAKAIGDFPMVNVSLDGSKIIIKKSINIGMAAALPSGNLIVPVIKNANHLNLLGLTKSVNDLANRARANKLKPEDIQGGTFTLTNVGTFGNVMGTPIINQPQVAILAVGAIRKKPAVVETEYGDLIAIRHLMFMSLSYDHRIVDGFLGGSFLRRIGDYLEAFDAEQGMP